MPLQLSSFALGAARLPLQLAAQLLRREDTVGTALCRLGISSIERRSGPLLWFHVRTQGECSTALPIIYRTLQVTVQLVPLDNPVTVWAFIRKWQPQVGVFLETPFHAELAVVAAAAGVKLALLNAHMPGEDVLACHATLSSRSTLKRVLSSYGLIVPRSDVDVARFRIFGATLGQMPGWSTDLQQASELGASAWRLHKPDRRLGRSVLKALSRRQLWLASNTSAGEEALVARTHLALRAEHKGLLTLVFPRLPDSAASGAGGSTSSSDGAAQRDGYVAVARKLCAAARGLRVELLSNVLQQPQRLAPELDLLVLDDADALQALYSLAEVVFVGGSMLPSPSEDGSSSPVPAAVAGCALLMGPYGGRYLPMASELNHAAMVASEEVAAAVASAGAAMAAGEHTPGRRESAGSSGGGAEGYGYGAMASARGAGSPPRSRAVSSGGRASWQQLIAEARPTRAHSRPVTAPPTVPEDEHLVMRRANTPGFDLFDLSAEHRLLGLQAEGSLGAFSAASYGPAYGSYGMSSSVDLGRPYTAGRSAGGGSSGGGAPVVGGSGAVSRRRTPVDRFRWGSGSDHMGFGYCSWSGSDEEGEEEEELEGADPDDEATTDQCHAAAGSAGCTSTKAAAHTSPDCHFKAESCASSLYTGTTPRPGTSGSNGPTSRPTSAVGPSTSTLYTAYPGSSSSASCARQLLVVVQEDGGSGSVAPSPSGRDGGVRAEVSWSSSSPCTELRTSWEHLAPMRQASRGGMADAAGGVAESEDEDCEFYDAESHEAAESGSASAQGTPFATPAVVAGLVDVLRGDACSGSTTGGTAAAAVRINHNMNGSIGQHARRRYSSGCNVSYTDDADTDPDDVAALGGDGAAPHHLHTHNASRPLPLPILGTSLSSDGSLPVPFGSLTAHLPSLHASASSAAASASLSGRHSLRSATADPRSAGAAVCDGLPDLGDLSLAVMLPGIRHSSGSISATSGSGVSPSSSTSNAMASREHSLSWMPVDEAAPLNRPSFDEYVPTGAAPHASSRLGPTHGQQHDPAHAHMQGQEQLQRQLSAGPVARSVSRSALPGLPPLPHPARALSVGSAQTVRQSPARLPQGSSAQQPPAAVALAQSSSFFAPALPGAGSSSSNSASTDGVPHRSDGVLAGLVAAVVSDLASGEYAAASTEPIGPSAFAVAAAVTEDEPAPPPRAAAAAPPAAAARASAASKASAADAALNRAKSDSSTGEFEFPDGGADTDDSRSGSPTLLATPSLNQANSLVTRGSAASGAQDASAPRSTAGSTSSAHTETNSGSGSCPHPSHDGGASTNATSSPSRSDPMLSSPESDRYEPPRAAGTPSGASVISPATSPTSRRSASTGSASPGSPPKRPGIHHVASIGSWLDRLGTMLAAPTADAQRSRAEHDPLSWFPKHVQQQQAAGEAAAAAHARLEGVAPGLRAPMHSPARPMESCGFSPEAVAAVRSCQQAFFPPSRSSPDCVSTAASPAAGRSAAPSSAASARDDRMFASPTATVAAPGLARSRSEPGTNAPAAAAAASSTATTAASSEPKPDLVTSTFTVGAASMSSFLPSALTAAVEAAIASSPRFGPSAGSGPSGNAARVPPLLPCMPPLPSSPRDAQQKQAWYAAVAPWSPSAAAASSSGPTWNTPPRPAAPAAAFTSPQPGARAAGVVSPAPSTAGPRRTDDALTALLNSPQSPVSPVRVARSLVPELGSHSRQYAASPALAALQANAPPASPRSPGGVPLLVMRSASGALGSSNGPVAAPSAGGAHAASDFGAAADSGGPMWPLPISPRPVATPRRQLFRALSAPMTRNGAAGASSAAASPVPAAHRTSGCAVEELDAAFAAVTAAAAAAAAASPLRSPRSGRPAASPGASAARGNANAGRVGSTAGGNASSSEERARHAAAGTESSCASSTGELASHRQGARRGGARGSSENSSQRGRSTSAGGGHPQQRRSLNSHTGGASSSPERGMTGSETTTTSSTRELRAHEELLPYDEGGSPRSSGSSCPETPTSRMAQTHSVASPFRHTASLVDSMLLPGAGPAWSTSTFSAAASEAARSFEEEFTAAATDPRASWALRAGFRSTHTSPCPPRYAARAQGGASTAPWTVGRPAAALTRTASALEPLHYGAPGTPRRDPLSTAGLGATPQMDLAAQLAAVGAHGALDSDSDDGSGPDVYGAWDQDSPPLSPRANSVNVLFSPDPPVAAAAANGGRGSSRAALPPMPSLGQANARLRGAGLDPAALQALAAAAAAASSGAVAAGSPVPRRHRLSQASGASGSAYGDALPPPGVGTPEACAAAGLSAGQSSSPVKGVPAAAPSAQSAAPPPRPSVQFKADLISSVAFLPAAAADGSAEPSTGTTSNRCSSTSFAEASLQGGFDEASTDRDGEVSEALTLLPALTFAQEMQRLSSTGSDSLVQVGGGGSGEEGDLSAREQHVDPSYFSRSSLGRVEAPAQEGVPAAAAAAGAAAAERGGAAAPAGHVGELEDPMGLLLHAACDAARQSDAEDEEHDTLDELELQEPSDGSNVLPRITLSGGPLVVSARSPGTAGGRRRSKRGLAAASTEQSGSPDADAAGLQQQGAAEQAAAEVAAPSGSGLRQEHQVQDLEPLAPPAVLSTSPRATLRQPRSGPFVITTGVVSSAAAGSPLDLAGPAPNARVYQSLSSLPDPRFGSPPRSPAERTSCPRGSRPTASPVKAPLHASRSYPSLLLAGRVSPAASVASSSMAASCEEAWLSGGAVGAAPHSPSSPLSSPGVNSRHAATYISPCATDPRASPIKVPVHLAASVLARVPRFSGAASTSSGASGGWAGEAAGPGAGAAPDMPSGAPYLAEAVCAEGGAHSRSGGAHPARRSSTASGGISDSSSTTSSMRGKLLPGTPKKQHPARAREQVQASSSPIRSQRELRQEQREREWERLQRQREEPQRLSWQVWQQLQRDEHASGSREYSRQSSMEGSQPMRARASTASHLGSADGSCPATLTDAFFASGVPPPTPRSARQSSSGTGPAPPSAGAQRSGPPFAADAALAAAVGAVPGAAGGAAAAPRPSDGMLHVETDVHSKRMEEQLRRDRMRAESRADSTTGTPRSARKLFPSDAATATASQLAAAAAAAVAASSRRASRSTSSAVLGSSTPGPCSTPRKAPIPSAHAATAPQVRGAEPPSPRRMEGRGCAAAALFTLDGTRCSSMDGYAHPFNPPANPLGGVRTRSLGGGGAGTGAGAPCSEVSWQEEQAQWMCEASAAACSGTPRSARVLFPDTTAAAAAQPQSPSVRHVQRQLFTEGPAVPAAPPAALLAAAAPVPLAAAATAPAADSFLAGLAPVAVVPRSASATPRAADPLDSLLACVAPVCVASPLASTAAAAAAAAAAEGSVLMPLSPAAAAVGTPSHRRAATTSSLPAPCDLVNASPLYGPPPVSPRPPARSSATALLMQPGGELAPSPSAADGRRPPPRTLSGSPLLHAALLQHVRKVSSSTIPLVALSASPSANARAPGLDSLEDVPLTSPRTSVSTLSPVNPSLLSPLPPGATHSATASPVTCATISPVNLASAASPVTVASAISPVDPAGIQSSGCIISPVGPSLVTPASPSVSRASAAARASSSRLPSSSALPAMPSLPPSPSAAVARSAVAAWPVAQPLFPRAPEPAAFAAALLPPVPALPALAALGDVPAPSPRATQRASSSLRDLELLSPHPPAVRTDGAYSPYGGSSVYGTPHGSGVGEGASCRGYASTSWIDASAPFSAASTFGASPQQPQFRASQSGASDDSASPGQNVRRRLFRNQSALEPQRAPEPAPRPLPAAPPLPGTIPLPPMPSPVEQANSAASSLERQFHVMEAAAATLPLETRMPTPLAGAGARMDAGPLAASAAASSLERQFHVIEAAAAALPLETRVPTPLAAAGLGLGAAMMAGAVQQFAAGGAVNARSLDGGLVSFAPQPSAARPSTAPQPTGPARAAGSSPAPVRSVAASSVSVGASFSSMVSGGAAAAQQRQRQLSSKLSGSSALAAAVASAADAAPAPLGLAARNESIPSLSTDASTSISSTGGAKGAPWAQVHPAPAQVTAAAAATAPGPFAPSRMAQPQQWGPEAAAARQRPASASTGVQVDLDAEAGASSAPAAPAAAAPPGAAAAARAQPSPSVASVGASPGERMPHTRYSGQYLVPASALPCGPRAGPAVWVVAGEQELVGALSALLKDPVERRSRGRAAAQGAAKLASSLVGTVWGVLDDLVVAPALHDFATNCDMEAAAGGRGAAR